jgi:hypothetical protein
VTFGSLLLKVAVAGPQRNARKGRHGHAATHHRAPYEAGKAHPLRPATGTHFLGGKSGWGDLDFDRSVPRGSQRWRARLTAPGERPAAGWTRSQWPCVVLKTVSTRRLARERRAGLPCASAPIRALPADDAGRPLHDIGALNR